MQALLDTNPSFLRFPGGCISEGSYTWDNVYDWKKSIGTAEQREENYNVWGYAMTMGLGYLEYFQMAEDLGAEPLPVMACGVLCQARSDDANAAGGDLMITTSRASKTSLNLPTATSPPSTALSVPLWVTRNPST